MGRRRKVVRARRLSELCEATISELLELSTRPGVLRLRTLLLRAQLLLPLPLLRGLELGLGVGVGVGVGLANPNPNPNPNPNLLPLLVPPLRPSCCRFGHC